MSNNVRFCHWHAEGRCWGRDDILAEDYDGDTVWWACEGHAPCWDHDGNDWPILDMRRYDPAKFDEWTTRGLWSVGGGDGRWSATRPYAGAVLTLTMPTLAGLIAACRDFDGRTA